jgi:hypothetical protein
LQLKDGAIPLKAGQAPVVLNMKRKPPTMRNEPQITTKKPKVSSTSDVGSIRYQPKSLLSRALAVVDKVYKAMVHENKETKCQLRLVQRELDTTKANMQEKTFGMGVIKQNNELCQHYTGFPDYERLKTCFTFLSVGDNGENVRMRGSTEKKGSGRP